MKGYGIWCPKLDPFLTHFSLHTRHTPELHDQQGCLQRAHPQQSVSWSKLQLLLLKQFDCSCPFSQLYKRSCWKGWCSASQGCILFLWGMLGLDLLCLESHLVQQSCCSVRPGLYIDTYLNVGCEWSPGGLPIFSLTKWLWSLFCTEYSGHLFLLKVHNPFEFFVFLLLILFTTYLLDQFFPFLSFLHQSVPEYHDVFHYWVLIIDRLRSSPCYSSYHFYLVEPHSKQS